MPLLAFLSIFLSAFKKCNVPSNINNFCSNWRERPLKITFPWEKMRAVTTTSNRSHKETLLCQAQCCYWCLYGTASHLDTLNLYGSRLTSNRRWISDWSSSRSKPGAGLVAVTCPSEGKAVLCTLRSHFRDTNRTGVFSFSFPPSSLVWLTRTRAPQMGYLEIL